ncbi:TonB-dependent receptor [Sphingomonas hylomeconis]|uniref:TonB-dependent receptor n=1 Tax=Sphingomonas hylomeconis TaxID=1395958 RepID=A0ABV7SWC5_9SPHN|nr:TonB-dependent receptor [Sphingomonas hylomeconis]
MILAAAVLLTSPAAGADRQATAADRRIAFDIPAGTLAPALNLMAMQADIDVALTVPALARQPTHAIRGVMTIEQVLTQLLRGTGAVAMRIAPSAWRVQQERAPRAIRPAAPAPAEDHADIIVTAAKRSTRVQDYPGVVTTIDRAALERWNATADTQAIVDRIATIDSTQLGAGRNKLFIRGISDSAFIGPLQASVGQYLGDIRLTYGAPDPDLALIDLQSIDVLEGPQATLYGSGSLGGIFHVVPQSPDLAQTSGMAMIGAALTAHGDPGADSAAVLNLPLAAGQLGLRLVGYAEREGGYIDDATRHVRDGNHVETVGGRATLRLVAGDWTADASAVVQRLSGADNQAADATGPRLTRTSPTAQPYRSDYTLGSLTIRRDWDDVQLISATGLSGQQLTERYDASDAADDALATVDQQAESSTFSSETRLASQATTGANWVVGVALAVNRSTIRTSHMRSDATQSTERTRLNNRVFEAALFGEATMPIAHGVTVTAGGRGSYTRLAGRFRTTSDLAETDPTMSRNPERHHVRVLPSIGVAWQMRPGWGWFARTQQGFRAGGATASGGSIRAFRSDTLSLVEVGVRIGTADSAFRLDLSAARSRWRDIQANSVTEGGAPITLNVGTATIESITAKARWRPAAWLALESGVFINRNRLYNPALSAIIVVNSQLANVAPRGFNANAVVQAGSMLGGDLLLTGTWRHVGKSRLGTGVQLDQAQGDYSNITFSARLAGAARAITLQVTNPLDQAGNRFALATPYRLYDLQVTPLRPLTVRLGIEARF